MSDLDRLLHECGISADYSNYQGEYVQIPLENRICLLKAMGVNTSDEACIQEELRHFDTELWEHWLTKIIVETVSDNVFVEINFKPEDKNKTFKWTLFDSARQLSNTGSFEYDELEEVGEYYDGDVRYSRRKLFLGGYSFGYYQLLLESDNKSEETILALCPSTVYGLETNEKIWGVIIQLYTLRSERNWGIGDFVDLQYLIKELADSGADTVGLNPLHALSHNLDMHFSPYNPSDRRFLNPLYIAPDYVVDFDGISNVSLDSLLEKLRSEQYVDYEKIRNCKYTYFQKMFDVFVKNEINCFTQRAEDFFSYIKDRGESLLKFSYFEATHQIWENAQFIFDASITFDTIPKKLPNKKVQEIDQLQLTLWFYCYLQWLAEIQLTECQQVSKACGMSVGLVRDLAVGADGGGSEVESKDDLFCRLSSIGAPPDPLAQTGQNWGMPPIIPSKLRESGYEHFIDLLRANMTHCGALRIDHAMSLMRLWWCPPGETADHGVYVYYPFRELLGLLNLESHLNQCLVIGEDLGVVPNEFREKITHAKLITNKVFYFEKDHGNNFKAPQHYEENALAMINNHDVPTLLSWWNGTDLLLRNDLNLLEQGVAYESVCEQRHQDKEKLMSVLFNNDSYPESWHGKSIENPADRELIEAILVFFSRVKSKIVVMQLEDFLMMDKPVNVPGTFHEHKNWQRKLSSNIEGIFSDGAIKKLLEKINQQRKHKSNLEF